VTMTNTAVLNMTEAFIKVFQNSKEYSACQGAQNAYDSSV